MPIPSSKSYFHRLLELSHVVFCNSTLSSVICISLLHLHDFLIFYLSVPDILCKNNPIIHLMFRTRGVTFCLRFYVQLYLKFCTNAPSPDNMSPFPCPRPPPNMTFCYTNMAYNFTWITPEFFLTESIFFLLTALHNVRTCVFFVFHIFLAESNQYTECGRNNSHILKVNKNRTKQGTQKIILFIKSTYDAFFSNAFKDNIAQVPAVIDDTRHARRPGTIEKLKEAIRQEVTAIPPAMTRKAMDNFRERLQECVSSITAGTWAMFL